MDRQSRPSEDDARTGRELLMYLPSDVAPEGHPGKKRLGDILVEMEFITAAQLEEALAEQENSHKRVGEILVDLGRISAVQLTQALARRLDVNYVDLTEQRPEPSALDLISEKDARRYAVAPVSFVDDHTLLVAMVDPANILATDALRFLTAFDFKPPSARQRVKSGWLA